MKRTIILLTFIFAATVVFAQKGKVTSALSYKDSGELQKALETIKETIDPANEKSEKTIDWDKTWEARGEIYQAIYESEDESIKRLAEDPLATALESYQKAIELDEKGKSKNSLKLKLTLLSNALTDQAVNGFNEENYEKALKSFEQILTINEIPLIKEDNVNLIDTVIIYNAGLAAYYSENYDKAIQYYTEAAKYGYNGGKTYVNIAYAYEMKNDTASALQALQEGFEKYSSDKEVLDNLINIYLAQQKSDDAMKYLDMAIENDPNYAPYYFAKGTLYESLKNVDKSIELYNKAIEVDPEYFDAHYNLGVVYYNQGVNQIEVARAVPANENQRYEEELAKADQWWLKSIPYMEKCRELKPDDAITLESLKNLYYRMITKDKDKWEPKYKEIDEILSNM